MKTTNGETVPRSCYVCGTADNPIIASETSEHRFGRPVMPEGVYRFARCRRCATLYVDSNVTDAYLSELYQSETEEWVDGVIDRSDMVMRRVPEFEAHWADMKLVRPPRSGDRLLDIGCQTGEFGSIAQRDGIVPNGVDLSPEYAGKCQTRWGQSSRVHCGPLDEAPFEPHSLQYISAFETLEHMCDPIEELRVLHHFLSADGILAVSVPSTNYFHFKFWLLRKSPIATVLTRAIARRSPFYATQVLPHTHIYNFSDASLRMMLERAGFETVMSKPTGWRGPTMNRLADMVDRVSRREVRMAPSVFAIARPVPQPS